MIAALPLLLCSILMSVDEADGLYNAEKWTAARAAYEQALPSLSPKDKARALTRMGYTWQRDQRMANAIEQYRRALAIAEIEPTDASFAQLQIGGCLHRLGKNEQAAAEMALVPKIKGGAPNDIAEAYLVISSPLVKLGRVDEAIEALKQVEHVQDCRKYYRADAYLRLGSIHQRAKRYREAINEYQRVLEVEGATAHQKEYARGYIEELKTLAQGDLPFYIQPYVIAVRADSATLCWVSQGEFKDASVTLAENDQPITVQTTSIRKTVCFQSIANLSDLKPGTRYSYRIQSGDEERRGSFTTCATDKRPVAFAVIGDTQAAPDLHRAVANAIIKDKPDFVIHVGDLTDRGSTWGKWRSEFFDPGLPYMQYAGVVPAVGNHDGGHFYPDLFELDAKRMYYSFDHGDVHVAVLDSYWFGASRRGGRSDQLQWLDDDLTKTTAKWKIIALHVPMIATNRSIRWFGEDDFRPLIERHGVDLVLAGHHPLYRKYLPIGPTGKKPILHVTSGGGGPVTQPVPSPILDVARGAQHHSFITIDSDRLELVARLPNGAVVDRFELIKRDEDFQESVTSVAVDPALAKKIRHLYQELLADDRRTLVVDVEGDLKANEPATLVVDTDTLPRGALDRSALPEGLELVVTEKPGSPWRVEPQAQPMAKTRMPFIVTPPSDLSIGAARFEPRFDVIINLKLGNRIYQPTECTVALNEAATNRFAAAGSGLPASWRFRLDPNEQGDKEKWFAPTTNTDDWRELLVTAWWEKQIDGDYDGIAWYRVDTDIAEPAAGQRAWLVFGAIDETCWVYINGKRIAEQIFNTKEDDDAWRKPRRFDITEHIKPGRNTLAVKVRDLFGMGGIYQGAALRYAPANRIAYDDAIDRWSGMGEASVSTGNATYVGEKSIRIEHRGASTLNMTRTFSADLAPGTYRVKMQYKLQRFAAEQGEGIRMRLRLGDQFAELIAQDADIWETASCSVRVSDRADAVDAQLVMSEPGILVLDEITVEPVETP